jgi:hypothetical protein
MSAIHLILIVLVVLLVLSLPIFPYNAQWTYGYYPSGALSLIVLILIVLLLAGRL